MTITKDDVQALWADVDLAIMKVRAAAGDAYETSDDVLEWQEDAMERLAAIVQRCGHPTAEQLAAARFGPVLAVRVGDRWEMTDEGMQAFQHAATGQESEDLFWHPRRPVL